MRCHILISGRAGRHGEAWTCFDWQQRNQKEREGGQTELRKHWARNWEEWQDRITYQSLRRLSLLYIWAVMSLIWLSNVRVDSNTYYWNSTETSESAQTGTLTPRFLAEAPRVYRLLCQKSQNALLVSYNAIHIMLK